MRNAPEVRELDVAEFARWRSEGRSHVLVDVRDDDELELSALDGALHIPMREIPARTGEIPSGNPVVVMCHVGVRSARVAAFLASRGLSDVYNLEGGIDAYSAIDPAVPRYS